MYSILINVAKSYAVVLMFAHSETLCRTPRLSNFTLRRTKVRKLQDIYNFDLAIVLFTNIDYFCEI